MAEDSLYLEMRKHLMEDGKPSEYFNRIIYEPIFRQYPFNMLLKLKNTEQSPKHHPEGSVWEHTMLVIDESAGIRHKSAYSEALMWAALLHDVGKPETTSLKRGKITAYNHDKVGAKHSKIFLQALTDDKSLIDTVAGLIKWHMQSIFVLKDMPYADIGGMLKETDLEEEALLCLCDKLGRLNVDRKLEEEKIRLFLQKCRS
ncbi:MAG: HDIG domain-containing metalloprotein [Clostridiaceae bacterium]